MVSFIVCTGIIQTCLYCLCGLCLSACLCSAFYSCLGITASGDAYIEGARPCGRVFDERAGERYAGLVGIADGVREAGIRYAGDNIGVDAVSYTQLRSRWKALAMKC